MDIVIIQEEFFFVKISKKFYSKMLHMELGKIIKDLRVEKHLSQMALAKAIGVSQKAIDFWERGINEPKASYIALLAKFFEVSADYLLCLRTYP